MVSILRTRHAATALALVLLPLASACSGNGGEALPSRTATPSRTLSATGPSGALPSATRDSPSGLPSRTEDSESATADATDATDEPTPEQTAEESVGQPSVEASVEESAAETTESTETAEGDGSDAWPLWVLVALVVLGILFALWHHRHARRRDERAAFDLALSESRWVGEDLLPTLLMASRDERRGAWGVARPRVVALQHQLAELATPGSESAVARSALRLETAVIGVRGALDDESTTDRQDSAAEALGAVKQAARQLDQVLQDLQPTAGRPG